MTRLRPLIGLICVAAVLVLGYVGVYLPVQAHQDGLARQIANTVGDIAALEQRVAASQDGGGSDGFPGALLWSAQTQPDAELALQDAVVGLAAQHGLTLIAFGPSGLGRDTAQPMVAFEFEAEAPLQQMLSFFAAAEGQDPKMAIGMLRLRPAQNYGGDAYGEVLVYTQATVWAFWSGET